MRSTKTWLRAATGLTLAAGVTFALLIDGVSFAQEDPEETRRQRDLELHDVNERLRETESRAHDLEMEIARIGTDRAELNRQLIDAAARIKDYEAAIVRAEQRLDGLGIRQSELARVFAGKRDVLVDLLAALQRIGKNPPPAVLVRPDDALAAIRSAMLVGAVFPGLREETAVLARDLGELIALRQEIEGERESMAAAAESLFAERQRLAALIDAKQESQVELQASLDETRDSARDLAREAADLRDLIAALDAAVTERDSGPTGLSADEIETAFSDPGRIKPAVAFADSEGLLPLPASGALIREFGAPDTLGRESEGISIATRADAQVTAPSDGWIVYAGPFRSYGQLLIIDAGDGYHLVLAGMSTISVQFGQFVLAGEPVGQMGSAAMASAGAGFAGQTQPVLYVEFRRDGRPIDPSPWWSKAQRRN